MTDGGGVEPTTPLKGHDTGEGWHLGLVRYRVLAAAGIVIGLALITGGAVAALAHGATGRGTVLALMGIALFLTPWWQARRRLEPFDYEGRYGAGLALPLRPTSLPAIVTFTIIGGLGVTGLVAIGAGRADASIGARVLGAVFCAVLGFGFLLGAYAGVLSRLRRDRFVLLTERGIVLTSERKPVEMPWGAVRAIRPHWTSRRQGWIRADDLVSNWLSFDVDPDRVTGRTAVAALARTEQPTLPAEQLAVDPWLALAVLRHYLEHAEDRAELRTTAALGRVVRGAV